MMTDEGHDLRSRQVDAAIAEYLEAVERGAPPDRAAFLAQHSDVAVELGEFLSNQQVLKQAGPRSDVELATVDLATATHRAPVHAPMNQIIRAGLSSQLEVQTLLRKRLRFIALLMAFAMTAGVTAAVVLSILGGVPLIKGTVPILVCTTAVIGSCGSAVWLWSRRPISLWNLRWIETVLFGAMFLWFGLREVSYLQSWFFQMLAGYHVPGIITAAQVSNGGWVMLIILYGLLIPNTARRCLAVLSCIALVRVLILIGVFVSLKDIATADVIIYFVISISALAFTGSIAIFGAHRIESLRRTAAEARKLGPYQLTRRLGAGGMGEVYLSQHALLRRPCALKLIRPDQVGDRRSLARFEREVQTMATLTHPNTVRVFDYGLADDGTFYYAMEYLPGLSLHELVSAHGPLPPARAVHLLRQVCEALREAHAAGLVHRDIKPANILACQIGGMHDVAKLLDFGLVRDHSATADAANLTQLGTVAGTPAFMSPEQADGNSNVDARSDIYSLGAVAYFLLTGKPPFVRATSVETMAAHLVEPLVAPRKLRPQIPSDLNEVVIRCLAKRPDERFSDVAAVEQALSSCGCRDGWSGAYAANWWQKSSKVDLTTTVRLPEQKLGEKTREVR